MADIEQATEEINVIVETENPKLATAINQLVDVMNGEEILDERLDKQDQRDDTNRKIISDSNSKIKNALDRSGELFSKGFSKFESTFSEAFAPFREIQGLLTGGFDIIKSGLSHLSILPALFSNDVEDDALDESRKQTGLLSSLLEYFYKEDLEGKRKVDEPDKGFFDGIFAGIMPMLHVISAGIGLVLGGITGYFIIPFQILFRSLKALKIVTLFSKIGKMLLAISGLSTKFGVIMSVLKGTAEPVSKIGKFIGKIAGWFRKVSTVLRGVVAPATKLGQLAAKFGKYFARGMKLIGWPITIIMGIFDFIKGYKATEGSSIDKVKAGLIAVVQGFFELPVKLIGWVTDKVLDIFGIEIEGGAASKIMAGIKWLISSFVDMFSGLFEPIIQFIDNVKSIKAESTIDWVWQVIKLLPGLLFGWIPKLWTTLEELISSSDIGSSIMEWIGNLINNIKSMFDWIISPIRDFITKITSFSGDEVGSTVEWIWEVLKLIPKLIFDLTPLGLAYRGIKKLVDWFQNSPEEQGKSIFDVFIEQFEKFTDFLKNGIIGKGISVIKKVLGMDNDFIKPTGGLSVVEQEKTKDIQEQIQEQKNIIKESSKKALFEPKEITASKKAASLEAEAKIKELESELPVKTNSLTTKIETPKTKELPTIDIAETDNEKKIKLLKKEIDIEHKLLKRDQDILFSSDHEPRKARKRGSIKDRVNKIDELQNELQMLETTKPTTGILKPPSLETTKPTTGILKPPSLETTKPTTGILKPPSLETKELPKQDVMKSETEKKKDEITLLQTKANDMMINGNPEEQTAAKEELQKLQNEALSLDPINQTSVSNNSANNIENTEQSIMMKEAQKEKQKMESEASKTNIFNESIQKYQESIQSMNQNDKSTNTVMHEKESTIPDEPESISLLIFNKNWGIA